MGAMKAVAVATSNAKNNAIRMKWRNRDLKNFGVVSIVSPHTECLKRLRTGKKHTKDFEDHKLIIQYS